MKDEYAQLLEEVMELQQDGIEKIQWMLKTVHDFSRKNPLFDDEILMPLSILYFVDINTAEKMLQKIKNKIKKTKEIIACLKEKDKKEKKYLPSKILADLFVVWEFTRLGKRMNGKSTAELQALLEKITFFISQLKHEAQIQLKQREHDES